MQAFASALCEKAATFVPISRITLLSLLLLCVNRIIGIPTHHFFCCCRTTTSAAAAKSEKPCACSTTAIATICLSRNYRHAIAAPLLPQAASRSTRFNQFEKKTTPKACQSEARLGAHTRCGAFVAKGVLTAPLYPLHGQAHGKIVEGYKKASHFHCQAPSPCFHGPSLTSSHRHPPSIKGILPRYSRVRTWHS